MLVSISLWQRYSIHLVCEAYQDHCLKLRCSFSGVLSHTAPHMLKVVREHAIGMLAAGISQRPAAKELNVCFIPNEFLQNVGTTTCQHSNVRKHVKTSALALWFKHVFFSRRQSRVFFNYSLFERTPAQQSNLQFEQHADMTHLSDGWKRSSVCIKSHKALSSAHENGSKTKSVVFMPGNNCVKWAPLLIWVLVFCIVVYWLYF